jgi:hypothetical protein
MKALICCFLSLFVVTTLANLHLFAEKQFRIDETNREKIENIFRPTATISILLRKDDNPDETIKFLKSLFSSQSKSFVVYNIVNHAEWLENCIAYQKDPSKKTSFFERLYEKMHKKDEVVLHETEIDPQGHQKSQNMHIRLQNFMEYLEDWWSFYYTGFIVFCPLKHLEYYVQCLLNRAGIFLFIIDNSESDENYLKILENVFIRAWNVSTNLKLHFYIDNKIYAFDPFAINEAGKFGVVKIFQNLTTDEDIKLVNGYPLRVELFYSVYSIFNESKKVWKFENMRGPDINVTQIILEEMNATSE